MSVLQFWCVSCNRIRTADLSSVQVWSSWLRWRIQVVCPACQVHTVRRVGDTAAACVLFWQEVASRSELDRFRSELDRVDELVAVLEQEGGR